MCGFLEIQREGSVCGSHLGGKSYDLSSHRFGNTIQVSELKSNAVYTQTPHLITLHTGLQTPNECRELFLLTLFPVMFLPFLSSDFMEGHSFLCTESNSPPPEVHSLWTGFGWTLQSPLKREPFPTVLRESSPFEVTAGLTKLISSIHNVRLMQCWRTLPLAGSRYWTRPKCNV